MFVLTLLLLAGPVERTAEREGSSIRGTVWIDRDELALSDSLRLELTVTGEGPLTVEPDADLLTDASTAAWHVRPLGPPTIDDSADGRKRWRRFYRLDPFLVGEMEIELAAVKVSAGGTAERFPLDWDSIPVRVTTEVTEAGVDDLRPITGVEELPDPPASPSSGRWWTVPLTVAILCGLAVLLWRWRSRRSPVVPPEDWAREEFGRLRGRPPEVALPRLADVWRGFCQRHWGLPAGRQTTAELLNELRADGRLSRESGDDLEGLLAACDLTKFAAITPHDSGVNGLLDRSVGLIDSFMENAKSAEQREFEKC